MIALAAPLAWGGVDVYLIYSGKNKAEKKALMKALPGNVKVKAYNADLLAVADYSGIQKAVAKFDKANAIVVLKDRPMEMLKGATVNKDLFIIHSIKTGLASTEWKVYVLNNGVDITSFGEVMRKKHIASINDLEDWKTIRSSDVLLVDDKTLEINKVVSHLVTKSLGR